MYTLSVTCIIIIIIQTIIIKIYYYEYKKYKKLYNNACQKWQEVIKDKYKNKDLFKRAINLLKNYRNK